ncbi:MAG: AAA family ATPase [Bradymonadales bacterium]|jgi:ATP-dependent Clp protease ATP-binding subunit ClpA
MEPQQLERIIQEAEREAENRGHEYVTCEHLFYVLLGESEVLRVLEELIDVDTTKFQMESFFKDQASSPRVRVPIQTVGLQRVVRKTLLQAMSAGKEFPRVIDLLIALMDEKDSFFMQILRPLGVTRLSIMRSASDPRLFPEFAPGGYNEFTTHLDNGYEEAEGSEIPNRWYDDEDSEPDVLSKAERIKLFLTNLNELAREGGIDPLIGRRTEVQRCWQVLSRRRKNNILLVGDSGVGKTAIAEGLALFIVNEEVPEHLADATIYSLSLTALLAGTKYRGEMEERLQFCIEYLKTKPNSILFIDELHNVVGAGSTSGSPIDVSNMLKPALASGELRCIGTTTYDDFRKTLSKDQALQRRFLKVDIDEPTQQETLEIVRGLQSRYEEFHNVKFTEEAIEASATLSQRYIQERKLPDKAIDVLDESAAANRILPSKERLEYIGLEEIEAVVAKLGNIPDLQASHDERSQLKTARERMKELVFGQDTAIEAVINLIKLSRAGLRAPQKPAASFLFAGPTGVGKTEIAKQLAATLKLAFVRFDMSEYQEEYTVSRLIGSAPGYVGFDNGGLLTEAVRKTPHCVLLLDEIEKAHPNIYDLLLQVMDNATLTDNAGRVANFQNVVLIMTSNAGGREMSNKSIGFQSQIDVSLSLKAIEKTFSPEFRNRLDEIVIFNPLSHDIMELIVDKFMKELRAQLEYKSVELHYSDAARTWLARKGYEPLFGARPLDRLIQDKIKLPIADAILFGELIDGGSASVEVHSQEDENPTIKFVAMEPEAK